MAAWRRAIELSRKARWPRWTIDRALGKEPTITIEAKAWLTSLACRKTKELGYPHEL